MHVDQFFSNSYPFSSFENGGRDLPSSLISMSNVLRIEEEYLNEMIYLVERFELVITPMSPPNETSFELISNVPSPTPLSNLILQEINIIWSECHLKIAPCH